MFVIHAGYTGAYFQTRSPTNPPRILTLVSNIGPKDALIPPLVKKKPSCNPCKLYIYHKTNDCI